MYAMAAMARVVCALAAALAAPAAAQCGAGEATLPCSELSAVSLSCVTESGAPAGGADQECDFGEAVTLNCTADEAACCEGDRNFTVMARCVHCYQLAESEIECDQSTDCDAYKAQARYEATCRAADAARCLGPRSFRMHRRCEWTSGRRWSTAFLLSLTLGGFGADRFYLGHVATGVVKLLTFGGAGVWTLLDAVLAAAGYLHPADGSLLEGT